MSRTQLTRTAGQFITQWVATAVARWLADRAAPGAGRKRADQRLRHVLVAVPVAKRRIEERPERGELAELGAHHAGVAHRPVAEGAPRDRLLEQLGHVV